MKGSIPIEIYRRAADNWYSYFNISRRFSLIWGTIEGNKASVFLDGYKPHEAQWFNRQECLVTITDEGSLRKMEILAGPHYRTILKAWEAKKNNP